MRGWWGSGEGYWDVAVEGLENMLFGGGGGRVGEYVKAEGWGEKEGAAGLKGVLERGMDGLLLLC